MKRRALFSVTLSRYWAYLPEDPLPSAQRYPVVYLLHGLHGNETRWFKSGRIAPLLDAAIAAGKVPPLIVVRPDGGDSWYVDNPDDGGFGNIATALTTDFIAAIDSGFPTLACREARIVGGFSMGGTGAMILRIDHPDLFAGVISLSGRFPPLMPEPTAALTAQYDVDYEGAFGDTIGIGAPIEDPPFSAVRLAISRSPSPIGSVRGHDPGGCYLRRGNCFDRLYLEGVDGKPVLAAGRHYGAVRHRPPPAREMGRGRPLSQALSSTLVSSNDEPERCGRRG